MSEQMNPMFAKKQNPILAAKEKVLLEQKKEQFDAKKQNLIAKIAERQLKYGTEDNIVNVLKQFLELSIKMEEFMDVMQSMNDALSCMGEAISFMDEALNMDNMLMQETMNVKYSAKTRIMQSFKTRRAMRNNRNRLKTVLGNIKWKFKMAEDMVMMVDKMAVSLGKVSFSKKSTKKKKQVAPSNHSAAVEDLITNHMKANGMISDDAPSGGSAPVAPSAPASNPGGLSSDDIDNAIF